MKKQNYDKLLQEIEKSVYPINNGDANDLTIAFLSLRSALRAWFSSYDRSLQKVGVSVVGDSIQDLEAYSEAIIHFHHFFELLIKYILRSHHELLATNAPNNPLVLYELLMGNKADTSQLVGVTYFL